ncbi:GNAT family N-acetyltransferase [Candidatus Dojkabacteria bacterium]|uniref:GNAT family N-acetyltransferase n=1 Tax=Candidatus Dojkabacteria bacterium TaxID=2099670 RepID=A0A955RI90_9BACT|nr:GNAT family N-acetyltransferase [Candidatus Dojkabacteria bacterium]
MTNIQPAQQEDAPTLAKIHVESWRFAYKGQIPDSYLESLSIEDRTESWQRILSPENNQSKIFVLINDDAIQGFISVGVCRDEDLPNTNGEVYSIYLDPSAIGKSFGRKLFEYGENILKEQGYKTASLWVLKTNKHAKEFYEKAGWELDGTEKTETNKGVDLVEVRYKKTL